MAKRRKTSLSKLNPFMWGRAKKNAAHKPHAKGSKYKKSSGTKKLLAMKIF